ncbi:hypothetical protein FHG87_002038 [Trinorchestia longiramus]|nr:hypothetical protein FHG87_002038 [Trinorchestia longiramus]
MGRIHTDTERENERERERGRYIVYYICSSLCIVEVFSQIVVALCPSVVMFSKHPSLAYSTSLRWMPSFT